MNLFKTLGPRWTLLAPLLLTTAWTLLGGLPRLDAVVYDSYVRLAPAAQSGGQVVIVAVDDLSLNRFGRWPWPRELQAQLLDRVTDAQVSVTGLDLLLTEPDRHNPQGDQLLAKAMARNGRVVLPVGFSRMGENGQPLELLPLPLFAEAAAGLGHVLVNHDGDGRVRRSALQAGVGSAAWPHFSQAVLRQTQPGEAAPKLQSTHAAQALWQVVQANSVGVDFSQLTQPTPLVSAADVLDGRAGEALRGKLVLIGVTAPGLAPRILTAGWGQESSITGIELNAALLRTLQGGTGIQEWPLVWAALGNFGLMLMWLGLCSTQRVKRRIDAAHSLGFLAVLSLSAGLLWQGNLWFSPVPLLAGLGLSYVSSFRWRLRRAEREAGTDALTGLANRRQFEATIRHNLRRAKRLHQPVVLLLLDVDHFKAYNDRYGHQSGDRALSAVGEILRHEIRTDTDLAGRIGGEEFAVMLTMLDPSGAVEFADRLRESLALANIVHEGSPLNRLTVSMGIAISEAGAASYTKLYEAADRALYDAKHTGRDRVGQILPLDSRWTPETVVVEG